MKPIAEFEALSPNTLVAITGGGSAQHAARTATEWSGHGIRLGIAGGALAGTLAAPVVGTVIGAGVGGLVGGFGGGALGYAKGRFLDTDR